MGEEKKGYEPDDREKTVIENWMPKGSERRRASEEREEWHKKFGGVSKETIEQLNNFSHTKDDAGDSLIGFIGDKKVVVVKSKTSAGQDTVYRCEVDNFPSSSVDAKELFMRIVDIKNAITGDSVRAEDVDKGDEADQVHNLISEVLGKKS